MRKNKHLLLWSSLLALGLLSAAAVEENFRKEWRRLQRRARGPEEPVAVHLRQVVVPALRSADRCVTCHVGMAAGEPAVAGDLALRPHPDVVHDPASFGCTVCHAGQGRATEKHDAHGAVPHWPEPMIPRRFADSGCGNCHSHLQVPNLARLHLGLAAFERRDCLACHALDGRGGTLRPGDEEFAGPDLSRAGASGYRADWYADHLRRWKAVAAGPWRTSFGELPDAERQALATLLDTRVGAPGLVEAKALFHSLGCRGCHRVAGVGGDDGPDLTVVGEKDPGRLDFAHVPGDPTLPNWLAEHFRSPGAVVPGSQMPLLGLEEGEIDLLNRYLLSLRRSDFPEAYWPRDRIRAERFGEREFATDGATLYGSFCAACHGPVGQGMRYPGLSPFPAIGNPDFLALADDAFLRATVQRGRPGRRMPAWGEKEGGLRPEEIEAVVRHLRDLGGVAAEPDPRPLRWVRGDAAEGERLYRAHCALCHGDRGQGAEGPALRNAVLLASASDTYLVETIRRGRRGTTMQGFLTPTPARPALADAEIESLVALLRTWETAP
jgi:mono/diheme cytochrome c family protein